jgi:hypothetical protein
MAKYTVEVRDLVEQGIDIFDFDYPIYDEEHKPDLEEKIINHYYFREIGVETIGRWKHELKVKMNEIMPKYNRLYELYDSQNINILSNQKTALSETETGEETTTEDNSYSATNSREEDISRTNVVDGEGTDNLTVVVDDDSTIDKTTTIDKDTTETVDRDTTNTDSKDRLFSDTPQGRLSISAGEYVTDITEESIDNEGTEDVTTTLADDSTTTEEQTSTQDTTTTNTGTSTQDITTTDTVDSDISDTSAGAEDKERTTEREKARTNSITGYTNMTEIELINIYVANQIEVDNLIIADLSDLFMRVY